MNNFTHKTPVQIRFNDIDIAGHVNNAVHMYYFDYGKMLYFNEVFNDVINWNETGFVLANINIDYENPIYLNEKIFVKTKIIETGNKSIKLIQQIENHENQLKSTCTSIMVRYNYRTKQSLIIDEKIKQYINKFENMK